MNDYERKLIQANDEKSMRSRVFVGNLNTLLVSREELQHRFGKYGPVRAVGIFKGYAFVQYDDEATARVAVSCEDQQTIVGQKVDCNLANEPKPNQRPGGVRKPKTGSSFTGKTKTSRFGSSHSAAAYSGAAGYGYPPMMYPGYYDPMAAYGYSAPPPQRGRSSSGSGGALYTAFPPDSGPRGHKGDKYSGLSKKAPGAPPSKRARPDGDTDPDEANGEPSTSGAQNGGDGLSKTSKEDAEALKQRRAAEKSRLESLAEELRAGTNANANDSTNDVLVCTCRQVFKSLLSFVEHKHAGCALRACAACTRDDAELRAVPLLCSSADCDARCQSAWELLCHYETVHATTLHKLVKPAPKEEPAKPASDAPPAETPAAPAEGEQKPAADALQQTADTPAPPAESQPQPQPPSQTNELKAESAAGFADDVDMSNITQS